MALDMPALGDGPDHRTDILPRLCYRPLPNRISLRDREDRYVDAFDLVRKRIEGKAGPMHLE
ncbi:hypothetical protein BJ508DRAFT_321583 [Ascobolus immersus RN42]|uniref:Uncharacterized protein n=1 Tax=Ascobolus immersus RN42 TaxID=1160509 RepID=A0A3N4IM11_ASCIM|nr:hypothetical protein BJ508DRAFT_321583 [Ascobolus immersus RN42]